MFPNKHGFVFFFITCESDIYEGMNSQSVASENLLPWVFRRVLHRLPGHVPQTRVYVTTS